MFFWSSLAFSTIQWMLTVWSLVPLPFLKPAWTFWKFTVHVLLKPGLENFEHYFTSMWDEGNCAAVWAFFYISHRYTYMPSLLSLPLTSHPSPPLYIVTEHLIWPPCIIEQIPTGLLFWIWKWIYFSATHLICPTLSFLPASHKLHKSVLYVSIAALQVIPSVSSF